MSKCIQKKQEKQRKREIEVALGTCHACFLPRALHAKAVEHDNGVRDRAIFSPSLQSHLPVPRVLPLCNGVVKYQDFYRES